MRIEEIVKKLREKKIKGIEDIEVKVRECLTEMGYTKVNEENLSHIIELMKITWNQCSINYLSRDIK